MVLYSTKSNTIWNDNRNVMKSIAFRNSKRIISVLIVAILMCTSVVVPVNVYGATDPAMYVPVSPRPIYTCYFNGNGGSVPLAYKQVQYQNIYGSLPTPTRNKYTFKGWYTAASGGVEVTQYSRFYGTGDVVLYARWQKTASYDKEVMKYINIKRKSLKLKKLKWDKKLTKGTKKRAKEITRIFSHTRPNGGSGARYLLKFVKKGRSSGECLGKGFTEPSKLVTAFMNSPAHRRIIMMKKARTVAVSSTISGGTTYWCVGTSALYKRSK